MSMEKEQDHVDRWLATASLDDIPNLDLAVEGIVHRMNGLTRRIRRSHNEVLAEHGLTWEDWDVLGALRRAGPPYRRSAGMLANDLRLSTGAMTNRLDRLEEAGLIRRLPDPNDRRGTLIEPTEAGHAAWDETVGTQARREAMMAAVLTEPEREELHALLRKLMRAFPESIHHHGKAKSHDAEPNDAED